MTDAPYRTGSGEARPGTTERLSRRTTASRQVGRPSRGRWPMRRRNFRKVYEPMIKENRCSCTYLMLPLGFRSPFFVSVSVLRFSDSCDLFWVVEVVINHSSDE
jgi:hypothetical protein